MHHDIARPALLERSIRGHTVLMLSGDLDIATSTVLRDRITAVMSDRHLPVVVDLSLVSFCDASGLSLLIALRRRAELRGCTLALAAPRPQVRKLLHVTGLDRSFPIYPNVTQAMVGGVKILDPAVV
jgi:anti-anti-sigma factor